MDTLQDVSGARPGPDAPPEAGGAEDAGRAAIAVSRFVNLLLCLIALPLILVAPGGAEMPHAALLAAMVAPSLVFLACQSRFETAQSAAAAAAAFAAIALGAWSAGALTFLFLAPAAMLALDALELGTARARAFPLMAAAAAGAAALAASPGAPPPAGWFAAMAFAAAFTHAALTVASLTAAAARLKMSLSKSRASLQETVSAMREAVLFSDAQGAVIKASPNAAAVAGEPLAGLAGRGLFSRLHVADRVAYLKAASDACHSGTVTEMEMRLSAASGAPPRVLAARIGPAAGGGAAVTLRDATAAAQTLESLREAEKQRLEAARSRGLFVSALSHKVRTPLNAVIGFSEMLANKDFGQLPPEQVREYAGIIHESGQTLLRVVTATIDLIRIESGTYEIDPQPLDAARIADVCLEGAASFAQERGVTISFSAAPGLPEILADRRSLKQVIGQVLHNAVKFSPAGGAVEARALLSGAHVRFTIADNGPGISKEAQARLGDAFFQGDATYARSAEGAGMGLALAKGLARLNKCGFRIDSQEGRGTLATIDMPVYAASSQTVRPMPFPAPAMSIAMPLRKTA